MKRKKAKAETAALKIVEPIAWRTVERDLGVRWLRQHGHLGEISEDEG